MRGDGKKRGGGCGRRRLGERKGKGVRGGRGEVEGRGVGLRGVDLKSWWKGGWDREVVGFFS